MLALYLTAFLILVFAGVALYKFDTSRRSIQTRRKVLEALEKDYAERMEALTAEREEMLAEIRQFKEEIKQAAGAA